MKVLLLGAAGMLARDLLREAPASHLIDGRDVNDFDITNPDAVAEAVRDLLPDVIINAAAYTRVDEAETERGLANTVNGEAPGFIGHAAAAVNARVIQYSTDYVFDGSSERPYRENDSPSPIGVYGASKLLGERRLAESGAAALIIRTQWLFGVGGPSFPATMWKRATAGEPTRVVDDQTGRPTYTVDLARATWELLGTQGHGDRKGQQGAARGSEGQRGRGTEIVHVANGGTATWYEVAKRVFAAAGRPELLEPCTSAEYPTPARRPAWSVLSTEKYEKLVGGPLPPWEDAIDRFLEELQSGTG